MSTGTRTSPGPEVTVPTFTSGFCANKAVNAKSTVNMVR